MVCVYTYTWVCIFVYRIIFTHRHIDTQKPTQTQTETQTQTRTQTQTQIDTHLIFFCVQRQQGARRSARVLSYVCHDSFKCVPWLILTEEREDVFGGRSLEIGCGWWSGLHLQVLEGCLPRSLHTCLNKSNDGMFQGQRNRDNQLNARTRAHVRMETCLPRAHLFICSD